MNLAFSEHDLLLQYIKSLPNFPKVLLDVGANRGTVSLSYAEMGWRVIAYEPEAANLQALQKRLQAFEKVTIVPKAVSNISGEKLSFYISPEHYGIHSLKPFHESHTQSIEVETIRLDDSLETLGIHEIGFLKIDIEGADFLALQGFDFAKTLPRLVMVEFMDERSSQHFGYNHHDMAQFMQSKGYRVWISEWAEIESYGRSDGTAVAHRFLQCVPYPLKHQPAWGNLIFVPEADNAHFSQILESYLKGLQRKATSQARRAGIEALPFGKQLYRFLRKIRQSIG